ncbi:MAG: DUF6677 family protein [Phycisphaerales bacterium]
MSEPPANTTRTTINTGAAVLAWVVPGAGYVMLGDRRRGVLAGGGVLGLFLLGMLIGGVDVVDRAEDTLWFVAQAGAGPVAWVADFANAELVKAGRVGEMIAVPTGDPRVPTYPAVSSLKGVARPNELGTLYCAMAGLMNVAVILDVLGRRPGGRA